LNPSATHTRVDMSFSPQQQLQPSSKTEKKHSIRQLCTHLSRNRCVSWSLNVVLAASAIVLMLVDSLDVVQTAFCVHLVAFCITCAILVWTKDSKNAFVMSVGFPVGHFVLLLFIIWDCEPLFFVLKLAAISCLWFSTRQMRITGARLVYAFEHKPKSRVGVTTVQLLIGASLVLMASLHLAYPELDAFSFAEMALWGCFVVDVLWHFGIWKMTMKRVFLDTKGMHKILPRQNASLNRIKGVKRRQIIITTVGTLFGEIITCACMIFANPALDLQDKSNECKQRNSVGSNRISAFGFSNFLAVHIACLVLIYTYVLRKKREERQVLQIPSLIFVSENKDRCRNQEGEK
jgi:hypothetical protein